MRACCAAGDVHSSCTVGLGDACLLYCSRVARQLALRVALLFLGQPLRVRRSGSRRRELQHVFSALFSWSCFGMGGMSIRPQAFLNNFRILEHVPGMFVFFTSSSIGVRLGWRAWLPSTFWSLFFSSCSCCCVVVCCAGTTLGVGDDVREWVFAWLSCLSVPCVAPVVALASAACRGQLDRRVVTRSPSVSHIHLPRLAYIFLGEFGSVLWAVRPQVGASRRALVVRPDL